VRLGEGNYNPPAGLLVSLGCLFRNKLRLRLFANFLAMGANNRLAIFFGGQACAGGFGGAPFHGRLQSNAFDRADFGKGGVTEDEACFGAFSGWALLLWHAQNLSHFWSFATSPWGCAEGVRSGRVKPSASFRRSHILQNCYIAAGRAGWSMKRYVIFAVVGPFLGGFLLLVATTVMSGYWNEPSFAQVIKLLLVFVKSLQYSYLFGILPMLMIAAVDDILFHVKRIGPVVRMLMVGVIAFMATEFLYGSRGSDSGTTQFILYGLVGFVPTTVSSWLAHLAIDKQAAT
jgi:hypothetical protein